MVIVNIDKLWKPSLVIKSNSMQEEPLWYLIMITIYTHPYIPAKIHFNGGPEQGMKGARLQGELTPLRSERQRHASHQQEGHNHLLPVV